jgi:hypothetical protein
MSRSVRITDVRVPRHTGRWRAPKANRTRPGVRVRFLTDFPVARELTRESGGSVPLGDMSLPRIWLEGLDLIGAWS